MKYNIKMNLLKEYLENQKANTSKGIAELKGKRIRAIDLAKACGLSQGYLSGIVNGKYIPKPDKAKRISEFTGIPILSLLFPEDK